MGLFTAAVSVCSMVGSGGTMAVLMSGTLAGGKPIIDMLKGMKRKLPQAQHFPYSLARVNYSPYGGVVRLHA